MAYTYALISPEGSILEFRTFDAALEEGAYVSTPGSKPYLLPVVGRDTRPDYDPSTQVLEGPSVTIGADAVTYEYTVREKNAAEVEAMKAPKLAAIKDEFVRRVYDLIAFDVGGTTYNFDADKDALENLTGVVSLINSGAITAARAWKPNGAPGISMAPADFVGLVGAIAARKDALYTKKWTLEAQIAALTSAADVVAFDPTAGWE